ncbi:MAG: 4-hydroxy-3-methylbut-2-enyl diphosphate reductase [Bacteroidetes bacterium GWE2_41_25]|nr:MAG: 4-hydroxy-3-methylbut-2-enyl diphosphate reductase [Bacteroidetes bacterium GWC2_40_22]OFY08640.1 MAG: 4-hydroxy-3-methylbut-2-enyl diphosphate reductase [Bacteroidetes bacterium GWE2_41_25]OFY60598.1 MAG: 4-hydroxy-3-methylbut-2-enyl diphosphate reductase [Bacteroidetes bacterium GWF2_41_9]HAM10292.1 4-hydroxy-3-methylbut-2-enyl diphosphate reductase [Bacteroidales bacterium]HBH85131.1 4-hydroxy-3-methylbut-2-enyl diphosphate reductase [Bacteroidales bacterium]
MQVEIDKKSGFCFGVQNAVEIAEKALLEGEKVYSLGPIVHNDMEVKRLSAMGLVCINHDEFRELRDCKVLIRAHGEPPETYFTAQKNNIIIIEATCPIVKKLQLRIKDSWTKNHEGKTQVVIFGKPAHAEVIGLLGQIGNNGILVSRIEDLHKIDFTRPVSLFSQTTMSVRDYNMLADTIRNKIRENGERNPDKLLKVNRTICGQVSNREPHLKDFSRNHDIIIFVSGYESSNGKMLYQVCKSVNPHTYFVSSAADLDMTWFKGKTSAGVCGATSTPKWLIENIRDIVSNI